MAKSRESGSTKFAVTIEGIGIGLLLHAWTDEATQSVTSGSRQASRPGGATNGQEPRDIAAQFLYLGMEDKKTLVIPQDNLFACMIGGGRFHKIGRSQCTTRDSSLVPAGLAIMEAEMPIKPQKWEVDIRRVINQNTKQSIVSFRPWFPKWSVSFTLLVDHDMFSSEDARIIVDYAGKRIGVGTRRPERKGPYGRFVVTEWKKLS